MGLSITLYDLAFTQDAHPDPPVLHVRRLDASVQWKAILHGRLVADFDFADPALYVNLAQLRAEAADPTPLDQHGWQDAFEAIYPLKINEIRLSNGPVTYMDDGPFKPLEISRITVRAENIRNIHSKERTYPSDLHLEAVVFGTGRIVVDGHADFLAVPIPGVQGDVKLEGVALDYFKPVLNHGSVAIQGGLLAAAGSFEWGPTVRTADLKEATISGMKVEYVQTPQTAGVPREGRAQDREGGRAGEQRARPPAPGAPGRARQQPGRLPQHADDAGLSGLHRRRSAAGREFHEPRHRGTDDGDPDRPVHGQWADSGPRPLPAGGGRPRLRHAVAIEATDLRTMNDMLRAYGKFDVVGGVFSFYSELR